MRYHGTPPLLWQYVGIVGGDWEEGLLFLENVNQGYIDQTRHTKKTIVMYEVQCISSDHKLEVTINIYTNAIIGI